MSLEGKVNGRKLVGNVASLRKIHGYSAYELAVINGFSGTEKEWLESLAMLTSPNGTKYKLTVDDNGNLSATAV